MADMTKETRRYARSGLAGRQAPRRRIGPTLSTPTDPLPRPRLRRRTRTSGRSCVLAAPGKGCKNESARESGKTFTRRCGNLAACHHYGRRGDCCRDVHSGRRQGRDARRRAARPGCRPRDRQGIPARTSRSHRRSHRGAARKAGSTRTAQHRIGAVPADGFASFLVGEGIETVLSLIAAAPKIGAAAALSAGSLGAARGPASPPRSSSPSATTSTTTSSRSVRRRCAPGSLRSSASRGVEESGVTGEVTRKRKGVIVPVINLRNEPKLRAAFEHAHVHDHAVLIGRRTKWGNRFRIGPDGSREEVIARYRADLWRRIRDGEIAIEELADLASCRLACCCYPENSCHGEVLARAAAWAAGVLAERDARHAGASTSRAASPSAASPRMNPASTRTATMLVTSTPSTIRCTIDGSRPDGPGIFLTTSAAPACTHGHMPSHQGRDDSCRVRTAG